MLIFGSRRQFVAILLASVVFALAAHASEDMCDSDCAETQAAALPLSAFCRFEAISEKLGSKLSQKNFLSPDVVESVDSRTLGEMIVKRLNEKCDKARDPSMKAPDDAESEIMMLVPDRHIGSIFENGFKNQHETSVTGGSDAKADRLTAEMGHVGIGLPYTTKTRELLPKYALQVFNSGKMGYFSLPLQYGNVMFRFKPNVKRRSTWSARDSLGMTGTAVPLRTNSIRVSSGLKCMSYCEAQIWGDLDRADVASIVVPEGLAITDEMKRFNVPIYTYKRDEKCNSWGGPVVPGCERPISIAGLELSKKPAHTPENKTTDVKTAPAVQSIEAIRDLEGKETNPVKKSLLMSKRLSLMSSSDLLTSLSKTALPKPDYYTSTSRNLAEERTRILAELTGRKKDETALKILEKEAVEGQSPGSRAVALSGLAELPPVALRPILFQALKSEDKFLKRVAFYMALDMKNWESDPEMLKALELADKSLLQRIQSKVLCTEEKYD